MYLMIWMARHWLVGWKYDTWHEVIVIGHWFQCFEEKKIREIKKIKKRSNNHLILIRLTFDNFSTHTFCENKTSLK